MKIHYGITDHTKCGMYIRDHMRAAPSNITTDPNLVTCNNCMRHSAGFVGAEELQFILESMIDMFTCQATDDDTEQFKKENPGLKWDLGFEEAIHEFADRKSSRELMIAALIKDIKLIEAREE